MDLFCDLTRETISVLEGATVLVSTTVAGFECELVEVVAFVYSVDLYAVHASFAKLSGTVTKVVNHFLNLFSGEGTGNQIFCPAVGNFRSGCTGVLYVNDGACQLVEQRISVEECHPRSNCHGTAKAACQLNEQFTTGLMELVHVRFQLFVHSLVVVQPASAHGITDNLHTRKNQTDIILSSVQQEVCCFFIEVARLQPAKQRGTTHGTLDDTVFDFYVANFKRRK